MCVCVYIVQEWVIIQSIKVTNVVLIHKFIYRSSYILCIHNKHIHISMVMLHVYLHLNWMTLDMINLIQESPNKYVLYICMYLMLIYFPQRICIVSFCFAWFFPDVYFHCNVCSCSSSATTQPTTTSIAASTCTIQSTIWPY